MGNRLTTSLVSCAAPAGPHPACTASPDPPGSSTAPATQRKAPQAESIAPRSTGKIKPVWTRKLEPIGQPVLQHGVALVITGAGQLMELVALNVKNGKGRVRVVFFHRGNIPDDDHGTNNWTIPVAVDQKSGKEVFRGKTSELTFTRPDECDDGTDFCLWRGRHSAGIAERVHVDWATGKKARDYTVGAVKDADNTDREMTLV